mmetsp:Transcript_27791/g.72138  ORF Transcript_27791/g.72138 Transcript_27791/m.72138 type:complete len:264 (-) Transcript_27791:1122-1913(-)
MERLILLLILVALPLVRSIRSCPLISSLLHLLPLLLFSPLRFIVRKLQLYLLSRPPGLMPARQPQVSPGAQQRKLVPRQASRLVIAAAGGQRLGGAGDLGIQVVCCCTAEVQYCALEMSASREHAALGRPLKQLDELLFVVLWRRGLALLALSWRRRLLAAALCLVFRLVALCLPADGLRQAFLRHVRNSIAHALHDAAHGMLVHLTPACRDPGLVEQGLQLGSRRCRCLTLDDFRLRQLPHKLLQRLDLPRPLWRELCLRLL